MKVILLEDVKKQGKKGDILTVKDGYGSYLINNSLAVLETKGSKKVLEKQLEDKKINEKKLKEDAILLKEKLEKLVLKFKVKTGKNDMVFGSISTKQIVSKLKDYDIEIDKRKIKINSPINNLGITNVEIELHKGVNAILKIQLEK